MKVAVAGACSRSGKTALAVTLLRALPDPAALKFTTTDDVFERCPRGAPCVVCDIDVPFRVVEDPPVLNQPGTDTERLSRAGARRVLWVIAKRGSARQAWQAAVIRLAGSPGPLVIEGSTVVDLAQPDLLIFVVHPFLSPARWKPGSGELMRRADLVVVNRPADEPREPSPEVMEAVAAWRSAAGVRIADVTRALGEWAPELLPRLDAGRLLGERD
jgi:hypothetical protein